MSYTIPYAQQKREPLIGVMKITKLSKYGADGVDPETNEPMSISLSKYAPQATYDVFASLKEGDVIRVEVQESGGKYYANKIEVEGTEPQEIATKEKKVVAPPDKPAPSVPEAQSAPPHKQPKIISKDDYWTAKFELDQKEQDRKNINFILGKAVDLVISDAELKNLSIYEKLDRIGFIGASFCRNVVGVPEEGFKNLRRDALRMSEAAAKKKAEEEVKSKGISGAAKVR
ncbi:MAG: hypothetical protein DDT23_00820 [candidate division WS2 bacterium]|nr:hypothetical protein [Candidatus Lithacetigena glycinireducens]